MGTSARGILMKTICKAQNFGLNTTTCGTLKVLNNYSDIQNFKKNNIALFNKNFLVKQFFKSYCNTIPTPDGGSHESGLRTALLRGLKSYGDLAKVKRAAQLTAEDIFSHICGILNVSRNSQNGGSHPQI